MTDIEIARNTKLNPINKIAEEIMIKDDELEPYGKFKAKISNEVYERLSKKEDGKLILVTAINPTPLGEGKTTVAIGLADGLRKIGKKSIAVLREPSQGPVFGMKGGATGGGHAQIAPMEDINLHFTGDIHAITSANNLLASMIDNHIYFGNKLDFKEVIWRRCLDVNDRSLRKIQIGLSGEKNLEPREDGFDITAASEIMAIFCLATDIDDLKKRLGNILVGYNSKNEPIYARELNAEGALTVLLKDALKPNLVQTLEHTPAIVHGGPFANIAHGCNSVVATKLGLKLADYVITEAGFGADLGAEKFMDIKTRLLGKTPNVTVCVATIKALKYHGGMKTEELNNESLEYLKKGYENLKRHIRNLKNFGANVIVAINRYTQDTENEIELLRSMLKEEDVSLSLVEAWAKGGEGAEDLAQKVSKLCENETKINYTYDLKDSLEEKIRKVAQNIYGAKDVELSDKAKETIKTIESMKLDGLPICIAKTQYSLSDDPKNLECKEEYIIHVRDLTPKTGAGFIVVYAGSIFTMPGLPRVPAAEHIDLDEDGNIVGIF
ncbi:MAG: formate--tetrahydrofolate ligase [Clostridia bacterium]|nr:formate--tetrahydrofolate ligase [Clostridia bacterium]